MATTRERIHQLIEEMPESDLATVELLLTERHASDDPFLRALASAPEDDEPLTQEEQEAIQEGVAAIARGDVVRDDEMRRTLRR